jgi:hypothetical protein
MSGVEILASSKILHCQNPPNSSLQKPQSKFSIKDDAKNQF